MDHSDDLSSIQAWNRQRLLMIERHDDELRLYRGALDNERNAARIESEKKLQDLKARVPSETYEKTCVPMARGSLENALQQVNKKHQERTRHIREAHRQERENHESQKPRSDEQRREVNSPSTFGLHSVLPRPSSDSGPNMTGVDHSMPPIITPTSANRDDAFNAPEPGRCTIRREIIDGQERLMLHYRFKKRKGLQDDSPAAKRLRVDTSVNSLRTPVATPSVDDTQPLQRTITFDEVFQGGNAEHKDVMIEWPADSQKWYILKCEEHGVHFKERAAQGAAKHLNGKFHGFPDRKQDAAVKELGYLVVDCTERLANLNNQTVAAAYARGYQPMNRSIGRNQPHYGQNKPPKPIDAKYSANNFPTQWAKTPLAQIGQGSFGKPTALSPAEEVKTRRASAPMTSRNLPASPSLKPMSPLRPSSRKHSSPTEIITHPKTFHIYHGHWRTDNSVYPVMILSWDDQTQGGLKVDLVGTGLLNKKSYPPACYVYMSNKIVGWAPGYEDGGYKVKLRKYPVMFFDDKQTVAWIPTKDLSKFPLYKPNPPKKHDHPFNAARRWIAEREGYRTWEEREAARAKNSGNALLSFTAPLTKPLIPTNKSDNSSTPSAQDRPVARDRHDPADYDDPELDFERESVGESDRKSVASNETEKVLKEVLEKGGEIPGDDDYPGSGSDDVDSNLDIEMEDWDAPGDSSRPWTFYGLRSSEDANAARNGEQHTHTMTGVTKGMASARRLSQKACSLSNAYLSMTGLHGASPGQIQTHRREADDSVGTESGARMSSSIPFTHGPANLRAADTENSNSSTSTASETQRKGTNSWDSLLGPVERVIEATRGVPNNTPKGNTLGHVDVSSNTTLLGHQHQDRAQSATASTPTVIANKPSEVDRSRSVPSTTTGRLPLKSSDKLHNNLGTSGGHKPLHREPMPPSLEPLGAHGPSLPSDTTDARIDLRGPAKPDLAKMTEDGLGGRSSMEKQPVSTETGDATPHEVESGDDTRGVREDKPRGVPRISPAPDPSLPVKAPISDAPHADTCPREGDFQLSRYDNGTIAWHRPNGEETCVKLFYGADRKTVSTSGGPIDITVDPATIVGFTRNTIPDSGGNSLLMLRSKGEARHELKLVFDRNKGSKLDIGKIQTRSFIRWLRGVNRDIGYLDP